MRPSTEGPVAVLGAGPAGLACAWTLAKQGVPVTVLERENRVGGLCRTLSWNGYSFDLGGHRFLTDNLEILSWVKKRLGEQWAERERSSQIVSGGQWYRYPPQWGDVFKQGGPLFLGRATASFLVHALLRGIGFSREDSFEDWVVSRFGKPLYELYFEEYSEKLWGVTGDRISSRWAAQRVSVPSLFRAVRELFPGSAGRPKTYASRFLYPVKGIGQLCEALSKDIRSEGGEIRLGCTVKEVALDKERVSEVLWENQAGRGRIQVAGCVSTIPLPHLLHILSPLPSSAVLDAARTLTFRGLRFVFLSLNTPPLTNNTWIYVPEKRFLFGRIQETALWEPSLAPEGKSGLILEIPCTQGDAVWEENLPSLAERCLADLKELGLDPGEQVLEVHDARTPEAYPVYHVGFERQVEVCLKAVAKAENLLSTGRQGLFRYNNMDHSLEMGRRAASFLQGTLSREAALDVARKDTPFE